MAEVADFPYRKAADSPISKHSRPTEPSPGFCLFKTAVHAYSTFHVMAVPSRKNKKEAQRLYFP